MRSDLKDFTYIKMCSYVCIILIIACAGIFILLTKFSNINISFDCTSSTSFNKYSIKYDDTVLAKLYTNSGKSSAQIFSDAHAMVIGDSTAEGLSVYGALYSNNVVWTRGRTIQYMEDDLLKTLNYQPDILFLAYGANDLLSWVGNDVGYINAYKNAVNTIRNYLPNTRICINAILPVSDNAIARDSAYSYEKTFNEKLKQFCEEENITFIDNRSLLSKSPNGKIYENDGVHPKPFYYKLWATNMIDCAKL